MDNFKTLKVEFFKDKKGKELVKIWLNSLLNVTAELIYRDILASSYRNISGTNKYQVAMQIEKKLWQAYNPFLHSHIIFTIDNNILVVLDGFIAPNGKDKATGKHLSKARKRLKLYMEEMGYDKEK